MYPDYVKVVEVGPRDGLKNEPTQIDTATMIELIDRLSAGVMIESQAR